MWLMGTDKHVQNIVMFSERFENEKNYWLDKLSGEIVMSTVPYDFYGHANKEYESRNIHFYLPNDISQKIICFSNYSEHAIYIVMLSGVKYVLQRYTGSQDIIVGVPTFKHKQNIDYLNNMLILRSVLENEMTFKELLKKSKDTVIGANQNANFPIEKILEILGVRSENEESAVKTIVLFDNIHENEGATSAKADIVFKFFNHEGIIDFEIFFNANKYKNETIKQIGIHLENFYRAVTENPDIHLVDIEIMQQEEKDEMLYEFNNTDIAYAANKTMHKLFEEQVDRTPDNTAIVFNGRESTYNELNGRANRLARFLKDKGIDRGDFVAILMDRSIEMVESLIGILKSGAAYIPLEVSFPRERVKKILSDLHVGCIITQGKYANYFRTLQWEIPDLRDMVLVDISSPKPPAEQINHEALASLWNCVSDTSIDRVTSSGFISSYTGKPFSEEEVDEYCNHVFDLAKPYLGSNKKVLEIGCGSGLIMYKVAPFVGHYVGLDPSNSVQKKNKEFIRQNGMKYSNIDLIEGFADHIASFDKGSFDLIIISSTVQFFPGLQYLENIVQESLNLLKDGATILIADIMDARKKEDFRKSLMEFKNKAEENPTIKMKEDLDSELYVDEKFFSDLVEDILQATELKILHRQKVFNNELKYRYDVSITKAATNSDHTAYVTTSAGNKKMWTNWHINQFASENLNIYVNSEDLAYIIFTSGSTGTPKGVMIQHRPVINIIEWINRTFNVNSKDRLLFVNSVCFDLSVYDIFGALASGASIRVVSKEDLQNSERLLEIMCKEPITIWDSAPVALQQVSQLFQYNTQECLKSKLRLVLLSGDWIPIRLPDIIREHFKDALVVSLGGATEATIWSNYYIIDKINPEWISIPYGKPVQNAKYYILDSQLRPCPIGIPGDLYIGGECLAKGYINDEVLTNEKFILNPYDSKPDAKIYKTGDIARWYIDGNMEFLGRKDSQVKIRGYRIELGEIESQLIKHNAVKEVAVIDKKDEDGNKYLCAYLILDGPIDIEELKAYLKNSLPNYMIPSYFVYIDKMPITSNGKLDRKSLPEPMKNYITNQQYLAPSNEIEKKLVQIWREILNVETVGVNDNFFDLGGHSLKAMNLLLKLRRDLGIEITLEKLFEQPTIRGISKHIKELDESKYRLIQPISKKEYYSLSSAQKRLFALQQFDLDSTYYNVPLLLWVEGMLDTQRLRKAFEGMIKRHESLRTSFEIIDGEVVQKLKDELELEIEFYKVGESGLRNVANNFVRPFDLSKAPLFRVGLVEITNDKHLLMIDIHHIISDGTSMDIFMRELNELYKGNELRELKIQYKDFSEWQNRLMEESDYFEEQERFWLELFAGEIPILNMPLDYPRGIVQNFEGDNVRLKLDSELVKKLKEMSRESGTTLYMLLLAAYYVLLSKYSGQEDIIVASPIAGRTHADLDGIIGMFVNTLAYRNYPAGNKTFRKFLEEVKKNSIKAFENQDYQFERLVEKLSLKRDISRNPLFDVMFTMENISDNELDIEGLILKPYEFDFKVSKFDMTLAAIQTRESIWIEMEYCTKLFKKDTVERIVSHFTHILESVLNNPDIVLSEIEIVTESEKKQILFDFNNTKTDYPREKTICELLEEQVERTPDSIAVICENQELTYRELNEKANSIARSLIEKGVITDSIVGIMIERSLEMIIGIVAILKAGGAYLPIDLDYPRDRIKYMLEDSKVDVLLTKNKFVNEIFFEGNIINLNDENSYDENKENLNKVNGAENLAYVIYTSGTTGRPKGVAVTQKNVVRLVKNTNYIEFKEEDRLLQTGSVTFDASTFEIWGALLNGIKLYLTSNDVILNSERLGEYLLTNKITIIWLTSPLFNKLCDENPRIFKGLRCLIVGGDVASPKNVSLVRKYNPRLTVVNGYGPTENTTFSTCYVVEEEFNENKALPIGRPIANSTAYILDKNNNVVPIGVYGELCVGGDGLSKGYLNNTELTAGKFVENPYESGQRMYRTGDMVRWLPDGNIEFLGRIDHQVKIRGFRIELAEVESYLLKLDSVKEAIVIVREEEGSKYLCSYLVSEKEQSVEKLKQELKKSLPDYMIPSYFIQMEKLPLTSNGKIDRKALPVPDISRIKGAEYEAPRDKIEEKLVWIWKEILSVEGIGINDNFFDLGGHSLKAINLMSMIRKEFNLDIPLNIIFKAPFIKSLADYLSNAKSEAIMPQQSDIVLISKGKDSDRNLFLIHSGNGEIGKYVEFCNSIKTNINCWGVNAKKLINLCPRNTTIEVLAQEYILKIKDIQPKGPYYIGGWCTGGTLAFEIVRQLEEVNEESGLLAIFDEGMYNKYSPDKYSINGFTLESEKKFVKAFLGTAQNKLNFKENTKLEEFWTKIVKQLNKTDSSLLKEYVDEYCFQIEGIPDHEVIELEQLVYYTNMIRTLDNARGLYEPSCKIKGEVVFFEAVDSTVIMQRWESYCEKTLKVYKIPGNHYTMWDSPNVIEMSKKLDEILQDLDMN